MFPFPAIARRVGTGERLSWDIGVKLPVKLDACEQERLRGYIEAYMASHAGSTTVAKMMTDIARAHPDLRIPAGAEALLVLNRGSNGNLLRAGADPLDIEHGGKKAWDVGARRNYQHH